MACAAWGPAAARAAAPAGKPGGSLSALALVARPGRAASVRSWTLETRRPRGPLHAVACSRDGSQVAAAGDCGTVRLYDAATGKLAAIFVGHNAAVGDLGFSADGSTLASAGAGGTIRLWRARSGKSLMTLKGHKGPVHAVAWSPDGKALASFGADGMLGLWRARAGRPVAMLRPRGRVRSIAWVLGGKALAALHADSRRSAASLWSATTGRWIRDIKGVPGGGVSACSRDGRMLAVACARGAIELRDFRTGKTVGKLQGPDVPVVGMSFSPDGKLLAANEQSRRAPGAVRLWDTKAARAVAEIKAGENAAFADLAWSGDGKVLAGVTADGQVHWWDAAGRTLHTIPSSRPTPLIAAAWSPDERTVACATPKRVVLWDVPSGRVRALVGGYEQLGGVGGLAWSPDSALLATGAGDGVRVLDANSARPVATIPGNGGVSAVTWGPDGSMLAYGAGPTICLATAQTWRKALTIGRDDDRAYAAIGGLWFSPNGKLLACGRRAGKGETGVDVWRIPAGTLAHSLDHAKAEVLAVAWSPDAKTLATGAADAKLRLWDAAGGHVRAVLDAPGGPVEAIAWSPDGRTLASGAAARAGRSRRADAAGAAPIRLWNARSGYETDSLGGHLGAVHSLAWSRDGKALLSAGPQMARLYEARSKLPWATFMVLHGTAGLAIGPEGHFAADEAVEPAKDLVYVLATAAGQVTLSPAEFAAKHGWKNDPSKAGAAQAISASRSR